MTWLFVLSIHLNFPFIRVVRVVRVVVVPSQYLIRPCSGLTLGLALLWRRGVAEYPLNLKLGRQLTEAQQPPPASRKVKLVHFMLCSGVSPGHLEYRKCCRASTNQKPCSTKAHRLPHFVPCAQAIPWWEIAPTSLPSGRGVRRNKPSKYRTPRHL
jgi:hypothetical protein